MPYPYFMPPPYPTSLGLLEIGAGVAQALPGASKAVAEGYAEGVERKRSRAAELTKIYSDMGYLPGVEDQFGIAYPGQMTPELGQAFKKYAKLREDAREAEAKKAAADLAKVESEDRYRKALAIAQLMERANQLNISGNTDAANQFLRSNWKLVTGEEFPTQTRRVPAPLPRPFQGPPGLIPIEEPLIRLKPPTPKEQKVVKVGEGQAGWVIGPDDVPRQVIAPRAKTFAPKSGGKAPKLTTQVIQRADGSKILIDRATGKQISVVSEGKGASTSPLGVLLQGVKATLGPPAGRAK